MSLRNNIITESRLTLRLVSSYPMYSWTYVMFCSWYPKLSIIHIYLKRRFWVRSKSFESPFPDGAHTTFAKPRTDMTSVRYNILIVSAQKNLECLINTPIFLFALVDCIWSMKDRSDRKTTPRSLNFSYECRFSPFMLYSVAIDFVWPLSLLISLHNFKSSP